MAWNLSEVTHLSTTDISLIPKPRGVNFSSDGTKMYICCNYSSLLIKQFNLNTAWDPSKGWASTIDYGISSAPPSGCFFKADGLKLYTVSTSSRYIFQHSLTTAWDLSTASYVDKSPDLYSFELYMTSVIFEPEGKKVFITGSKNDSIKSFNLSTAWDITTLSTSSVVSTGTVDSYPREICFNSTGTVLYVAKDGANQVSQYNLSSAYSLLNFPTSSVYDLNVSSYEANPACMCFNSDGTLFFLTGYSSANVDAFSLPAYIPPKFIPQVSIL